MSDTDTSVDGDLLRKQREIRGWTVSDIASRACLSVKQIRQLEEGGSESFYSPAVRLTAAKKVASLLGVSITPVLEHPQPSTLTNFDSGDAADPKAALPAVAVTQIEAVPPESKHDTLKQAPKTTQVSVWVLAALFGSALLVAAWLNPSAEPVAPEAAPPLQILSSDVSDTASSAAGVVSDVASSALAESEMGVVMGDQPASSASSSPSVRASNAAEAASK